MYLIKIRVQNFKSIVDSDEVDVDPTLTILVGKNEQGKSNFLKALESFNGDYKYLPSDLTSHLRPGLEERSSDDVPMVTVWLRFRRDDLEQLKDVIDSADAVQYLKVTKCYSNNYKYAILTKDNTESELKFKLPDLSAQIEQIKVITAELKNKLISHAEKNSEFAKNKEQIEQLIDGFLNANFTETKQIDNLVRTFCTGIRGVLAQDQQVQLDIATATKNLEMVLLKINQILSDDQSHKNKAAILEKLLPRFVFHSTALDKIPDEVNVAEFIANPEKTSIGMLKLCRAAGLSIQKIQQIAKMANASDREVFEDHYTGYLSGGINEFWTQEKYEVLFRIEQQKLSVSISDSTYERRIPPSQRSEGFQWYISFYSTIRNESVASAAVVILLDNPALELHVDGQRDIKKFLEEKIAPDSQIIYVTHSPAMVDPFKLEQIRTVELGRAGTKISNRIIKEGEHLDILEPLRSAIGASIGYSLIVSNYNILGEGFADKFMLEGVVSKFAPEIKEGSLINGSLSESKDCILARIYNKLNVPFVVVLDADSKGRELVKTLKKHGIKESNILELEKVFDRKGEYALADLFSEKSYHEAVDSEYSKEIGKKIDKPSGKGSKIEKNYEEDFKSKYGIEFSKVRVAKRLKKMLTEESRLDKETETNLEKLTSEVTKRLNCAR